MRTTLEIDDDVVAAARELAASERRSLGAVISELARRGLTPARIETRRSHRKWSGVRSTKIDARQWRCSTSTP